MNHHGFLKTAFLGAVAVVRVSSAPFDGDPSGSAAAVGAEAPAKTTTSSGDAPRRGRVELADGWRFQIDPWGEGTRREYFATDFDDGTWKPVTVPAVFEAHVDDMPSYEGQGWYRRVFRAPADWQAKRAVVRFEGVNYRCRVWLNGRLLGEREDPFLRFEFPISEHLRYGEDNVLAVHVDNTRRQGEVPGIQRGWRNSGGILREVYLLLTGRRWIEAVHIVAEPQQAEGQLSVEAELCSNDSTPLQVTADLEVTDSSGKLVWQSASRAVSLPAAGAQTAKLTGRIANVRCWSPETPVLYRAQITLRAGDRRLDRREVRLGFRRIECSGAQLLLNGRPIYLTGFNRHEDSPRTGMATDLATARRDLQRMKQAGANFVRLCHYPHHPGELDLCDELGLLVMGEIPLWQWDLRKESPEANVKKAEAARRQVISMIDRDRNHPSVIFWSVGNENHEYQPAIRRAVDELIKLARQSDPTRLATHVASFFWADHAFDADDVICINGYPNIPMWQVRPGADRDPDRPGEYFRAMLAELHERYPDKPILVSEFGHPCFKGLFGCQFGEDAQARLIEDAFAGMDAPYCCGATIWCWANHLWPESNMNTLLNSPFGVVGRDRAPSRGLETVRKMFTERQRRLRSK